MNRKELEQCTWDSTPANERRDRKGHRQRESELLTGNNREILVFDPTGSTPGTMSPWTPLWALFNDELQQRCELGHQPKLRAPYNRRRLDYKSSLENGDIHKRHHDTKKSVQLQREIDEVLAGEGKSAQSRMCGPSGHATKLNEDRSKATELGTKWAEERFNEDPNYTAFTLDMVWIDPSEVPSAKKREDMRNWICAAATKRLRQLRDQARLRRSPLP